jgi:hypothetical protein
MSKYAHLGNPFSNSSLQGTFGTLGLERTTTTISIRHRK